MLSVSKILCVDDEPDILTVLAAALRFTLKAEVTAVGSVKAAFESLETAELPDVIILDGMMPEIDGLTACHQLRADPRYQKIPIIFLSARSRRREQEEALAAGATACLTKPFDPMTVGQEILRALEEGDP